MLQVDRDLCGVCGRCVAFCPREALSVTMVWGRLTIDETACTECFGGSHTFENLYQKKAFADLLKPGSPNWNLVCTENCPVSALKAEANTE